MTNDRGRCNHAVLPWLPPAPCGDCGDGWGSAGAQPLPSHGLCGTALPAQRAGLVSGIVFPCKDTTLGRSNVWFYTEFG